MASTKDAPSVTFDPRERETQPDLKAPTIKMKRPSWDVYFLKIAEEVSTRATCDRKHVGALIVRDRVILATGYNGSVRELPHCDDEGHDMEDGHCVRTVHAEMNAIAQAARQGVSVMGARLYVNTFPCWPCFKVVANAGIVQVVFSGDYRNDPRVTKAAELLGIKVRKG